MRKAMVTMALAVTLTALTGCDSEQVAATPTTQEAEVTPSLNPAFSQSLATTRTPAEAEALWKSARADSAEAAAAKDRMSDLAIEAIKAAKTLEELEALRSYAPNGTRAALEYTNAKTALSKK